MCSEISSSAAATKRNFLEFELKLRTPDRQRTAPCSWSRIDDVFIFGKIALISREYTEVFGRACQTVQRDFLACSCNKMKLSEFEQFAACAVAKFDRTVKFKTRHLFAK